MRATLRAVLGAVVGICLAATAAIPASAQEDILRRLIVTENADYTGFDYETLRGVDQGACETACLNDNRCRAFTFNTAAGWCFLKNDFGALTLAQGAIAGRVVNQAPLTDTLQRQRIAELDFVATDYIDIAQALATSLDNLFAAGTRSNGELIRAANAARNAGNPTQAASLFGAALAIADEDPKVWLEFARANLARTGNNFDERTQLRDRALGGAINAYLRAEDDTTRAAALVAIGDAMILRQQQRVAIKALRASLALRDDSSVADHLARLVAEFGFRIISHRVDADTNEPRICLVFSDPIPAAMPNIADYVTVTGGTGLAIEPESTQICVDGVQHGGTYRIQARAGLPAADGEVLANTVALEVFVPDRGAWVGFAGTAYVLPAGPQPTIPIQSINTPTAEVEIYRIGDRSLVFALREGIFLSALEQYRAEEIANTYGERIWTGTLEIDTALNEMVTTAIPVEDALGDQEPGVYVITARLPNTEQDYWEPEATQWFVISDLGLTALTATDGIHAIIRSLGTALPIEGVTVRLMARNNEVLGEATTDANGYVRFAPGLARGTGGLSPQLIVADTGEGDYAFLDLTRTAFDLTDRGVEGRPAPLAVDAYFTTERGVYRPGETVYATALVRDSRAMAIEGLPLTVVVERPDGVENARAVLNDEGLGGYVYELALRPDAMRGSWRLRLYTDPEDVPIAELSFLVEDFEPERLAFELTTDATAFDLFGPTEIDLAARYLYGATAPNLTASGDISIRATNTAPGFNGYVFGRDDDPFERILEPIADAPVTDERGNTVVTVYLPEVPATTRLLEAEAIIRLTDTSGRAVERRLALPVTPDGPRIGIRPLNGYDVAEGATAEFDVIAISPEFERTAIEGASWTLSRVQRTYQWYSTSGIWRWESVTTTQRIDAGTIDIGTGAPARIAVPVDWGRYRLEVTSTGDNPTSSSVEFWAGWYVADAGTDTPDVLEVALDQPSYRLGDTARLRLDPQYAGIALIAVLDDRLIDMQMVEVPEGGTTVDLPITEEWGPGAYVTATLYRPMDLQADRMPARSLGLTWATVEPGDRDLAVTIDLPEEIRPRGPMAIPVAITNLTPGTEAYVTVAAVDLGILNLTNYQPPRPDDWYFGQRRLGTEIRDLYGNLIDTTQGALGALRSGGDGGAVRLGAPPPVEKLIAFHSGVVRVDENGEATVTFDMPDFNGTVRVMVQAWSAAGVGSAVKDVFVRDPVVVVTSVPRFLNVGDTSRILVEVNNISGPAGNYRLTVEADQGLALGVTSFDLTLAEQQRMTLVVPLEGVLVGDHQVRLALVMPDGQSLPKDFILGVRPPGLPMTQRNLVEIPAGGTLTLDATAFAGFVPSTAELTISAGAAARLDVAGVLASLDRYPYGCVEQTASRAMPLLYLNEVAAAIGVASDTGVEQRIRDAIGSVLAKQTASGAFGLWGPYDDGDLWLNAYVMDFLVRAEAAGFDVPELQLRIGLDALSNAIAYAPDFTNAGEDVAYALYVLASAGRASIGDLRYYFEGKLTAFRTPLARAQLGAALALYGDGVRAQRAFDSALSLLPEWIDAPTWWRPDYGSALRDIAAVLALGVQAGVNIDDRALADRIASIRDNRRWTSTQEDAWTLMAAAALIDQATSAPLLLDGTPMAGPLFRSYTDDALAGAPVTIENTGAEAVEAALTVIGIPVEQPAAGGNGYTIERTYYLRDGTLADPTTVAQNDRFVVVLTVTADQSRQADLLVVDPLPAGFEIENPNLSLSGDVSRYPWLEAEQYIDHTEARTDRYVAAVTRFSSDPSRFSVAYTVRAVSPGVFIHPGAIVEEMYYPERRANTAAGTVEVVGPTQ
ncbi:MAG: MG2 domain-containing protein [Bauldia sp.]